LRSQESLAPGGQWVLRNMRYIMFGKRIELLAKIDKETDWENVLYENADNYLDYEKLFNDKKDKEAKDKLKELLPQYFKIVHLINQQHIKDHMLPEFQKHPYDIGIFLVGYSIIPIILSVAEIRPKKIIFITSYDTDYLVDWILEGIQSVNSDYHNKIKASNENRIIRDLSDPAFVYRFIEKIIEENKESKIAIDITGGKKTMVAGSFMSSAMSKQCDIFYTDFEEYDPGQRQPYYNTEFLIQLPNPSEVFSINDWERLESLFDQFQYKEALNELDRIKGNINKNKQYFEERVNKKIGIIKSYAQAYQCWDDYNYNEALQYLKDNNALKKLSTIENKYNNKFRELKSKYNDFVKANNESIDNCKREIYSDNFLLMYYILDRYNNADRRYEQKQLQGSFLRLITLVEFILTLWAENNLSENDLSNISDKKNRIIFRQLMSYFLENTKHNIVQNVDLKSLNILINKRNVHILIHSIKIIDDNDFKNIKDIFFKIFTNLFSIKNFDLNNYKKIINELKFKKFREVLSLYIENVLP